MTSAAFAAIRKIKVGTGDARYVIDPNTIQNGTDFRLLGLPVIITDNIPNAAGSPTKARAALVDFSKVVVARDVNAEVKILDQTWGDYDSIGIRVAVPLGHRTAAAQGRHTAHRGLNGPGRDRGGRRRTARRQR